MWYRSLAGSKLLVLFSLLALLAVVAVACGDDPTPTAVPTAVPTETPLPATPTAESAPAMMFPGARRPWQVRWCHSDYIRDRGRPLGTCTNPCCAGGINTVRDLTNKPLLHEPHSVTPSGPK